MDISCNNTFKSRFMDVCIHKACGSVKDTANQEMSWGRILKKNSKQDCVQDPNLIGQLNVRSFCFLTNEKILHIANYLRTENQNSKEI